MSQGVKFIRVNGRVVPIKQTHSSKEVAKGVAAVGAGAAVAQIGKKAGGLINEAAKSDNDAIKLAKKFRTMKSVGPLFDHALQAERMKVGKQALRAAVKAKQLKQAAFSVRHGSTIASAALFGYGANKLLDQTKLKKNPEAKAAIGGAATAAATFAVRHAYARGVGNRGFKALKLALRKVVKA